MDALSLLCAAGEEAEGALASSYFKGFVVLCSEHSSVQNRMKTLNEWLWTCVETIAQTLKLLQ